MTFLLANWRFVGLLALVAVVGGYVWHCEHVKTELAQSVAIAKDQIKANTLQAKRDKQAKETADENYNRRITRLSADLKRLRDPSTSILPAAPPGSNRPELACFARTELSTALRDYREGIIGLLGEGAAAVEGLDEVKIWSHGR